MDRVIFRPYNDATDRADVVALWHEAFHYGTAHNDPALVIDRKLAVKDQLFFVAAIGDSVVGTTMAGYDGHRGWIYSVAVSPSQRMCGIGSRLVACAESALTALGCVKINLQIADGNETVIGFYEKLGFAVEKRVSMGKRVPRNIPT